MKSITLGDVPYLNSKPLVAGLDGRCFEEHGVTVRVVEAVPSHLAGMLQRREVAAAMISCVVPLTDTSLCALPVGAVTSDGPVGSIRLMSRVPPACIRRLALDASSRTSVVMCQVLLNRVYGVRPEIVTLPPDVPAMLEQADAALVIGDIALRSAVALEGGAMPQVKDNLDLGTLWRSEMGLPFVYAVWAAPRDGDLVMLSDILRRAAEWGVAHRIEIAEREAPRLGLPVEFCRRYVTENVCYDFGPREWAGMQRFYDEAVAMGLLPDCGDAQDCVVHPVSTAGPAFG